MSALASLQEKLKKRELILGTGISNITFSGVLQQYRTTDLDFVLFDCEHGTLNDIAIEEMLRTCRLIDLPSIVRIPGHHPVFVSRPLDMGADGIMAPRVDTLEQLDEVVRQFRFPPRGVKGSGGFSQVRKGEKITEVNDNRILCVQIESQQAAGNLDAMLRKHIEEIGFILIGPFDLALDVGTPGNVQSDEELKVIDFIAETCAKHNVSLGIFCSNKELMEFWKARGINLFWVTSEISLLMTELRRVVDTFKALK